MFSLKRPVTNKDQLYELGKICEGHSRGDRDDFIRWGQHAMRDMFWSGKSEESGTHYYSYGTCVRVYNLLKLWGYEFYNDTYEDYIRAKKLDQLINED